MGHRKSIDIDLFGSFDSDELEIAEILSEIGAVKLIKKSKKIFVNIVNGIKVDIVNYKYPWIEEPLLIDNLLMASKEDIVAMKLGAITGRGSKKDFVDLYFLLHEFSLKQMFDLYDKKFNDGNRFLVMKSLTYFEDANREQMPVMFQNVNWETIKLFIETSVSHFLSNINK